MLIVRRNEEKGKKHEREREREGEQATFRKRKRRFGESEGKYRSQRGNSRLRDKEREREMSLGWLPELGTRNAKKTQWEKRGVCAAKGENCKVREGDTEGGSCFSTVFRRDSLA